MLIAAVAAFFKYKVVGSVIIFSCLSVNDNIKLLRGLSQHEIRASLSFTPEVLDNVNHYLQGVLYVCNRNDYTLLDKVSSNKFANWYKWLIIGNNIPTSLQNDIRYDADIVLLSSADFNKSTVYTNNTESHVSRALQIEYPQEGETIAIFKDIYIHMNESATLHEWAYWKESTGFQLQFEKERLLRRHNLQRYPIKISTPTGHFPSSEYDGSFEEYLTDSETRPELDSTTRCSYCASLILSETLNASHILQPTHIWATVTDNTSMLIKVAEGRADLSGSILRPLHYRIKLVDYIMPLWPFSVGFTYLAERESSSNMFVEPFSLGVWWCCLITGLIICVVQRITARQPIEKDGALQNVMATFLQQDAGAVPVGASGRWTFLVLSVWAMLLHAYYTSAIVSALMSAGRSGPDSLRALADSKYAIASEDYDYMRYNIFDRDSNSSELEYLKKKKMTADLYQPMLKGIELVRGGNTAFHSEYNQIYPHLKKFSDEQVCKLSYVDTIPETLAWIVATKRSQFTDSLRVASTRIHETGIAKRLLSKWLTKPAPCRASLLAERVKFGDVAPLIGITSLGAVLATCFLALEVLFKRWDRQYLSRREPQEAVVSEELDEEIIS